MNPERSRWTVRPDVPRRAYGLSRKEWQLIRAIDLQLCDEVSKHLRDQLRKTSIGAPDGARRGQRLFSFGELQAFVGDNPRTASLVATRLCRKGILRKFKVGEARTVFGRLGLEIRAPKAAKRLYQFIPPGDPPIYADLPDMVAQYVAARILSASENEGIALLEYSENEIRRPHPSMFFANPGSLGIRDKKSKEADALRELIRSAQRLMTAHARRTFKRYPATATRARVPGPEQWWWNMRAPLIVLDLSWPRYPFGASAYPLFLALDEAFTLARFPDAKMGRRKQAASKGRKLVSLRHRAA